jgi:hypothetical protein
MGATLVWPAVAVLGFLLSIGVVVALGTTSTARYEFERNGAGQTTPSAAYSMATHPAGRRLAAPRAGSTDSRARIQTAVRSAPAAGAPPGWWLVGESARVVAGPFGDRIDADWAALAQGLAAVAVFGARRTDGTVAVRSSPEDQAWLTELGDQLDRLPDEWDGLLTDTDPLTTLVVEIAAALVEAGLPLADPAGSGGVSLHPDPASGGVLVSWSPHERMSRHAGRGATAGPAVLHLMNATVADVLVELGFVVQHCGGTGCSLVTALRRPGR